MSNLLTSPSILRLRRIHGLEHATINLLAQRIQGVSLAGHSDPGGFWLLGDVPTAAVQQAVNEALARMKKGERQLAIAPLCGTNIVTIGTLTGLAGMIALWDAPRRLRDKLDRLPAVVMLTTLAAFVALPLGVLMQQHVTTCGEPGDLQVTTIARSEQNGIVSHRVAIRP
ncbi:MAG: DUF6391 domain-containing protein [Chloroflexota bacterium]